MILGAVGTGLTFIPPQGRPHDHFASGFRSEVLYGWAPAGPTDHPNLMQILGRTMTWRLDAQTANTSTTSGLEDTAEITVALVPTGAQRGIGGRLPPRRRLDRDDPADRLRRPGPDHGCGHEPLGLAAHASPPPTRVVLEILAAANGFVRASGSDSSFSVALERPDDVSGSWVIGPAQGSHVEIQHAKISATVNQSGPNAVLDVGAESDHVIVNIKLGSDSFLSAVLPPSLRLDSKIGLGVNTQTGFYLNGGVALVVDLPVNLTLDAGGVIGMTLQALHLRIGFTEPNQQTTDPDSASFTVGFTVDASVQVAGGVFKATVAGIGMAFALKQARRRSDGRDGHDRRALATGPGLRAAQRDRRRDQRRRDLRRRVHRLRRDERRIHRRPAAPPRPRSDRARHHRARHARHQDPGPRRRLGAARHPGRAVLARRFSSASASPCPASAASSASTTPSTATPSQPACGPRPSMRSCSRPTRSGRRRTSSRSGARPCRSRSGTPSSGRCSSSAWGTDSLCTLELAVLIELDPNPVQIVLLGSFRFAAPEHRRPAGPAARRHHRCADLRPGRPSRSRPRWSTASSAPSRSAAGWSWSPVAATTAPSCSRSAASTRSTPRPRTCPVPDRIRVDISGTRQPAPAPRGLPRDHQPVVPVRRSGRAARRGRAARPRRLARARRPHPVACRTSGSAPRSRPGSPCRTTAVRCSRCPSTSCSRGPGPWHVQGYASLTLLFFTLTLPIDASWGDDSGPTATTAQPLTLVHDALSAPDAWSASMPPGRRRSSSSSRRPATSCPRTRSPRCPVTSGSCRSACRSPTSASSPCRPRRRSTSTGLTLSGVAATDTAEVDRRLRRRPVRRSDRRPGALPAVVRADARGPGRWRLDRRRRQRHRRGDDLQDRAGRRRQPVHADPGGCWPWTTPLPSCTRRRPRLLGRSPRWWPRCPTPCGTSPATAPPLTASLAAQSAGGRRLLDAVGVAGAAT